MEEGAVSVVGGAVSQASFVRRALAAVPTAGFEVAPLRLTLYVVPAQIDDAVRALHAL
jgi:hypothetical protein